MACYGIIPEGYTDFCMDWTSVNTSCSTVTNSLLISQYFMCTVWMTFIHYCSKLERKATNMRSALSTYSTWQSLPARDALHQSQALHSTLRSIASRCEDVETIPRATAKISFEAPCSDVLTTLGHLGRFKIVPKGDDEQHTKKNKLSNKNKEQLSQNSVHETHSNEGQPPNKKRKELI